MTDKKNCFAGQNIKKRAFGKMLFLCAALFLTVVVFTQCDWRDQAEFVNVRVYNRTGEDLDVVTGLVFFSIIRAGTDRTVRIIKDRPVSAIGKTSGKIYATRIFYYDNAPWTVNP
ncbi:hypothetical protein V1L52_12410 [Treponema sp. HNW]|uniref:hypothetical protein n=1 Tax=Treponema sp. HNW TaxID=3116654 RepID=UPI003D14B912